MFLGPYDRDPTRFWGKQLGGALYRRRPTLTDKIAEGVAMGLSGPTPSFLKLGAFLGKPSKAFATTCDMLGYKRPTTAAVNIN